MNARDLLIGEGSDAYVVRVVGRANFEYAVPLREQINSNDRRRPFRVDLRECVAMDSTFMGVLTMGALKASEYGVPFEIYNASDSLKKLLYDLGVDELFEFRNGELDCGGAVPPAAGKRDLLATAETVSEAHHQLADADAANAKKFDAVIRFADADLERLKKNSPDGK